VKTLRTLLCGIAAMGLLSLPVVADEHPGQEHPGTEVEAKKEGEMKEPMKEMKSEAPAAPAPTKRRRGAKKPPASKTDAPAGENK